MNKCETCRHSWANLPDDPVGYCYMFKEKPGGYCHQWRGSRDIEFFYIRCGEPLWEFATWEHIKGMTLEEVRYRLVCSDCLLKEARNLEGENNGELEVSP